MRLIDADAFDERVRLAGGMSEEELSEDFKDGVQTVLYMMSKQPTITAQPERPRGKWNFIGDNMFECTCCGVPYTTQQLNGLRNYDTDPYAPKFCPNCGAYMRGERNDEQASTNND